MSEADRASASRRRLVTAGSWGTALLAVTGLLLFATGGEQQRSLGRPWSDPLVVAVPPSGAGQTSTAVTATGSRPTPNAHGATTTAPIGPKVSATVGRPPRSSRPPLTGTVDQRPPVALAIDDLHSDRPRVHYGAGGCDRATASAVVIGEPVAVLLHWARTGSAQRRSLPMWPDGDRYAATIGPIVAGHGGDVRWWVTAIDGSGQEVASGPQTLEVASPPCRS